MCRYMMLVVTDKHMLYLGTVVAEVVICSARNTRGRGFGTGHLRPNELGQHVGR